MTNEKENITAKYQLDIAKRKYQYETKKEQYLKYYHLIDEYNGFNNKKFEDQMLPTIQKFKKNFLEAANNQKKKMQASACYANEVQSLIHDYYKDYVKFKHETSTVRLIAGSKVLLLLESIDYHSQLIFDKSCESMKQMSSYIISGNIEKLSEMKTEIQSLGDSLKREKELLIDEVRKELDEI